MRPHVQIKKRVAGDTCYIEVAGVVDEDADLTPLDSLAGRVELDLHGIRRFNSMGTRTWVDTMRRLARRGSIICVACSPAVVSQLNMIHDFLGDGTVTSFYGPMRCEPCDRGLEHLFTTSDCREQGGLPPVPCPSCGEDMELDELEDQYLLFVREPTLGSA